MKIKLIAFITISSLLVSSCATTDEMGKTLGSTIGAIGGGIGGWNVTKDENKATQIFTTVTGALGGGIVGGWLGSKWDQKDQHKVQEVLDRTSDGKTVSWTNPDNNSNFSMTLHKSYKDYEGQKCRSFRLVEDINGNKKDQLGKACRSSEQGRWKITSS